jgi:hypothetical protein
MNSRRFHKESLQGMPDATIAPQNLCHRPVMACRLLLALWIPPQLKRRKGRIRVSHYEMECSHCERSQGASASMPPIMKLTFVASCC